MDEQNIFRRIDPANRPIQLIMGLCLLAYSVAGPFLPTQGVAWAVTNLLEAVCVYSAVDLYRKMYSRLSPWLYVGIAAAIWCGHLVRPDAVRLPGLGAGGGALCPGAGPCTAGGIPVLPPETGGGLTPGPLCR